MYNLLFCWPTELSINIYRAKSVAETSTPTSMYRTPTDEFENQSLMARNSFSSCLPCPEPGIEVDRDFAVRQERKISIQVKQLEMAMVQRTYDMKVSLK